VSTRMRNVIAERKAQFDYVNNLDDAAVAKSLQTAQNKAQTAENKVNSLQKRLNDISTSTQGVKDKHNIYKAEVKARDESIAAEARIEEGIAKLDAAFFAANSDVDPKLIKAYDKAFQRGEVYH
jgi:peptidoglycan hydrolase CwlO-like protein